MVSVVPGEPCEVDDLMFARPERAGDELPAVLWALSWALWASIAAESWRTCSSRLRT